MVSIILIRTLAYLNTILHLRLVCFENAIIGQLNRKTIVNLQNGYDGQLSKSIWLKRSKLQIFARARV
jgi:hypothetical protein